MVLISRTMRGGGLGGRDLAGDGVDSLEARQARHDDGALGHDLGDVGGDRDAGLGELGAALLARCRSRRPSSRTRRGCCANAPPMMPRPTMPTLSLALVMVIGSPLGVSDPPGLTPIRCVDRQVSDPEGLTPVSRYGQSFTAEYCNNLSQMVPKTSAIENTSITLDDTVLQINTDTQSEATSFSWIKTVNQTMVSHLSLGLTVSASGEITSFSDNLCYYSLAPVQVTISRDDAIAIAEPYIEAYAKENGQTIKKIDAKFDYAVDSKASRGDSSVIYPQWTISAQLDKADIYNFTEYAVLIWGDNGAAYHYGPQGHLQTIGTSSDSTLLYLILLIVGSSILCTIVVVKFRHSRKHAINDLKSKPSLKFVSALSGTFLLCLALIPSGLCYNYSSTIYASRNNLPAEDIDAAVCVAETIYDLSSNLGYYTVDDFGPQTTANNIYYGARGADATSLSIAFYYGHGGHSVEWHYWGWPWQWHTHDYLAIGADDGSLIRDNSIWQNSVNYNTNKMVVLWSCHQGEDAMGSMITYPCGDTQEHGMPYAWNHVSTLSSDGYSNPDSSNQVFIGFVGVGPTLSYDGFGMDSGAVFLEDFYMGTLFCGWTVHDSLDYASQSVWGTWYSNCILKTGFTIDGDSGHLAIYGQGTRYV